MKSLLFIFIGGGVGSVFRYLISKPLNKCNIPYGTLLINVLGSLIIGLTLGYFAKNNQLSNSYTLLIATGFCGGFTTFSSFAFENYNLLRSGDILQFLLYTIGSFALSLIAVGIGIYLVK